MHLQYALGVSRKLLEHVNSLVGFDTDCESVLESYLPPFFLKGGQIIILSATAKKDRQADKAREGAWRESGL